MRKIHGWPILATPMPLLFSSRTFHLILSGILFLAGSLQGETKPATPVLTSEQKLAQEISALRLTRQLAETTRQQPPTNSETSASRQNYLDLIARYPQAADSHAVYGEFLLSIGEKENAFHEWQTALTLAPERDDLLAAQADLLLQTGQIVPAADALEKAAALAPKNADYVFGLAHIYTLFRRDLIASRQQTENQLITRGTAYFKLAAELAPENLEYAQAYAESFYTQPKPDWKLALAAWQSLLPRAENKAFIRSHLVRVNIRLGDKSAAQRDLDFLTDAPFAPMKLSLQKQIDRLPAPKN